MLNRREFIKTTVAAGVMMRVGTQDASAQENTISMVTESGNYYFDPIGLHVEKGGTVTFRIESGSHSSTAYENRVPEGATAWDSGVMTEQGKTFEHTFESEGTFDYYCTPHKTLGMVGRVVVGSPGGPAEESMPPDGDVPDSGTIVNQGSVSYSNFQSGSTGQQTKGQGMSEGGPSGSGIPMSIRVGGLGSIGALIITLITSYAFMKQGRELRSATVTAIFSFLIGMILIVAVVIKLLNA